MQEARHKLSPAAKEQLKRVEEAEDQGAFLCPREEPEERTALITVCSCLINLSNCKSVYGTNEQDEDGEDDDQEAEQDAGGQSRLEEASSLERPLVAETDLVLLKRGDEEVANGRGEGDEREDDEALARGTAQPRKKAPKARKEKPVKFQPFIPEPERPVITATWGTGAAQAAALAQGAGGPGATVWNGTPNPAVLAASRSAAVVPTTPPPVVAATAARAPVSTPQVVVAQRPAAVNGDQSDQGRAASIFLERIKKNKNPGLVGNESDPNARREEHPEVVVSHGPLTEDRRPPQPEYRLPPDWEFAYDKQGHDWYYWHKPSGVTQWEVPPGAVSLSTEGHLTGSDSNTVEVEESNALSDTASAGGISSTDARLQAGEYVCIKHWQQEGCLALVHGERVQVQWSDSNSVGWAYGHRVVDPDKKGYFARAVLKPAPPSPQLLSQGLLITACHAFEAPKETNGYLSLEEGEEVEVLHTARYPCVWVFVSKGRNRASSGWVPVCLLDTAHCGSADRQ